MHIENVGDQLCYLLRGRPCRFSKTEFALITGLNVRSRENNESGFDKYLLTLPKWTILGIDRHVTLVEFEDEFSTIDWATVKDAIAIRYARTLLGLPDDAIVDTQWLRLAHDIGMFNNYPWGLMVLEAISTMLRPANHTHVLRGFAFAAQA